MPDAGGIALVISTLATATATVGALAIPLWKERREEEKKLKNETYNRLLESINFCVENIDRYFEALADDRRRLALLKAGHNVDIGMHNQFIIDFNRNKRMVQLICLNLGVMSSAFDLQISIIGTNIPDYNVIDGKVIAHEGNDEKYKAVIEATDNIVNRASYIISSSRSAIDYKNPSKWENFIAGVRLKIRKYRT